MTVPSSLLSPSDLNSLLSLQASSYLLWAKQDQPLVQEPSFFLLLSSQPQPTPFTASSFEESGDYDFYCSIYGNWRPIFPLSTNFGIELSKLVIPIPQPINIRSLAIQARFKVRLNFHSSFYVFLRVLNKPTILTPVIKVVKDTNLKGIFLVFAHIDPETQKFQYVKQGQVPEIKSSDENVRELEIEVMDNGDDKVVVCVSGERGVVRQVRMGCGGFWPQLETCQVWIAGSGDSVMVSEVEIAYRQRMIKRDKYAKAECICSIC